MAEKDARTLQPLQVADQIEGAAAHDAPASGNPVQVGGVFRAANPAVADGDAVSLLVDAAGRPLIVGDRTPADALAVPTNVIDAMAILMALAPDAALDRLRTVGNTAALGLGVLAAAPRTPGASDVLVETAVVTTTESTRRTLFTPTAGTRARILAVLANVPGASQLGIEVYFGTGANIDTNSTSAIVRDYAVLVSSGNAKGVGFVFPDGGGPVGAVDEVVSTRALAATNYHVLVVYREE